VEQISKRCPRCREVKQVSDFRHEPSRPRGLAIYCRACDPIIRREKYLTRRQAHNDYARRYQQERPEKRSAYTRRYALKKFYGITPEQWDQMYERQRGCCLLCGEAPARKRLHVDHCHETGLVRGLLCTSCNSGIALLRHDPELLTAAIAYLNGSGRLAAQWKC
jgi:hypothetical protein